MTKQQYIDRWIGHVHQLVNIAGESDVLDYWRSHVLADLTSMVYLAANNVFPNEKEHKHWELHVRYSGQRFRNMSQRDEHFEFRWGTLDEMMSITNRLKNAADIEFARFTPYRDALTRHQELIRALS